MAAIDLMKCVNCDTPAVILRATGLCGTDDESVPCPFEVDECPAGGPHTWETLTDWEAGPRERGGTRCAECGATPASPGRTGSGHGG